MLEEISSEQIYKVVWDLTDKFMKQLDQDHEWATRQKNDAAVKIAEQRTEPDPNDVIDFEYNRGREEAFKSSYHYISSKRRDFAENLLDEYAKQADEKKKAKEEADKKKAEEAENSQ